MITIWRKLPLGVRLALAVGPPWGLGMWLLSGGQHALVWIAGGVMFGLLMGISLTLLQAVRTSAWGRTRATRSPVHAQRTVFASADLPTSLAAARQALNALGMASIAVEQDADGARLTAQARTTVWSWGESIEVQLSTVGDQVAVQISSRPRLPTTLLDYGKNQQNVEAVAERLAASLPPGSSQAERERATAGVAAARARAEVVRSLE